MNDTGYVALVDTDREELRDRIGEMRERFSQLARLADPHARRPGLDWTVHEVVAHMLAVAHRYRTFAEGRDFHRASHPRDLDQINHDEMKAVMAPIPELVDQIEALAPVMDEMFDTFPDDYSWEFHCGIMVSGIMAQTNWLCELVLHGEDIARSIGVPWEIRERDMLLALRGIMEAASAYVCTDVPRATNICVELHIPDARPYVVHVHDGIAEFRERQQADRPDAVLKSPASTATRLFYQRVGVFGAVRDGLRVVGGRRPWKALKFQSCFERI
jgi:hypothetical protein